jgi:hypothetical protein
MSVGVYESKKLYNSLRSLVHSTEGREIGEIPECVSPTRRALCERDFRLYCETYHAKTFDLAWSPDHIKVIQQIETAVLTGGLFATAMPRGSGKTSLAEAGCIWAILYGHHSFVALIGADEGHSSGMLESIKTELESNELLSEDFPEAIYPIERLEGIARRCGGQLHKGERTCIEWAAGSIVMPIIPGSLAAGAVVKVAGITGGLRGMKVKRQDGRTLRPSLVVVDDPQTDASARSLSQCETRERILAGAILGLAGPGRKISGILPCTVIRPGDMADRILDRQAHPEWNGTRTKMVYAFPTNERLWEEYGRIRADSLRAQHGGREATEFYRENREAMDAGALVAWEARHNPDELSALQHAMNLRLRDERAFFAEYQNEPMPEDEAPSDDLSSDQIRGRVNQIRRGELAIASSRVTGFIDVHASLLYYMVAAWSDDFTGQVVEYGTYPDQHRHYYTLRDAKYTLARELGASLGLEGQIAGGLARLIDSLAAREWIREDGAILRLERLLIDANWTASTDTILALVRQSPHAAILSPSHGKYYGAGSVSMREYKRRPGDRIGLNWRIPGARGRGAIRSVHFDTNFWKSFVHSRLSVPLGARGALSLYGSRPEAHQLLADHCTAEHRIRTTGRGREVDEWKLRPERSDNHLFDCLVGSAVAASIQGAALAEASSSGSAERPRVSFAEQLRKARQHER